MTCRGIRSSDAGFPRLTYGHGQALGCITSATVQCRRWIGCYDVRGPWRSRTSQNNVCASRPNHGSETRRAALVAAPVGFSREGWSSVRIDQY